jgi:endonuclease/exonuclease/phosphatase (EEP) superfamily protein YafD
VTSAARGPARWRLWLALLSCGPAAVIALALTAPWWPGEVCCHWTIHAVALLLPALLAFGRKPALGASLLLLIGLGCARWIVAALEPRAPAPPPAAATYRVVGANVATWNSWRASAVALAQQDGPSLLALFEVKPVDQENAHGDPKWPYQLWEQQPTGIGLLSSFPIISSATHNGAINPLIEAVVDVNGRRLRVIAVHTTSPTSPARQRERDRELDLIARLVHQDDLPALALGDYNLTVGDPEWAAFRSASGLLRPATHEPSTWPSPLGAFAIGIDHVLARGLAIGGEHAIWLTGSDHRGLAADIAFSDR